MTRKASLGRAAPWILLAFPLLLLGLLLVLPYLVTFYYASPTRRFGADQPSLRRPWQLQGHPRLARAIIRRRLYR